MYIFNIYYSSTIHQTTTFNLKCIFVHFHAHPLSKNWLSQHIFKKRFQIDASDLNLRVAKCICSKSTHHQQYTRQQPSTSNTCLSTSMHTLLAKIGWVGIFLTNRFQIDPNDLNLRGAKCIFSKSTPHQQYTRQHPSTSNAYLSSPMHSLWAKIGWVSIFLKNWFQIDANDLNLRVARCIFSISTTHQQYTRQQLSTSNAYLSTSTHTLWAKIGLVSILKNFKKTDSKLTQMTSIWELPNVYFQNLLFINNTPDNTLQPQMHICPLPCTPFEQKLAESAYFSKTDSKLTQMTSIWELLNVYFQYLLLINNTPDKNLQPQMHICQLPRTPSEQKLA